MPTIYFLVRSRVESFSEQKLQFNVLDQPSIAASTVFSVRWDQADQVAPGYCEPENPALSAGAILYLALSKSYCLDQGFSIVGLGKRPDYLGTDAPSGGWFVLPALKPKTLMLETHNGTRIDLLDDTLVLPGGISALEGGILTLVISAAAKSALGVAGALDPYTASGKVDAGKQPGPATQTSADDRETRARLSELFRAIGRVLETPYK